MAMQWRPVSELTEFRHQLGESYNGVFLALHCRHDNGIEFYDMAEVTMFDLTTEQMRYTEELGWADTLYGAQITHFVVMEKPEMEVA